jgi:hypothetical protein
VSRCPDCALKAPERTGEPWRALYKTKEWEKARYRCFYRDDGRCRGQIGGARCRKRTELQAHHRKPLRALWNMADGWVEFLELATKLEWLVSLCPRCHALAERDAA